MNYTNYEKIAERHVLEMDKDLSILRSYNKGFEDDLSKHMLKLLLNECSQNSNEIREAMNTNKIYFERLIKKYRG